jgi:hypothetical protein
MHIVDLLACRLQKIIFRTTISRLSEVVWEEIKKAEDYPVKLNTCHQDEARLGYNREG